MHFSLLLSLLVGAATGVFLRDGPKKVSSSVLRRRFLRHWYRRSTEMQLQCGKNDAFWGRLRKRQTPPLLFLFAPDVTWVPTSRFVRSVHAVSVSESDHHENVLSRSSSEQPPLDSFYSPSSVGKKDKKRGKLTTQTVGGPTRAEADEEGEQDKECLKVSCRGDGEEVLVEIPVIEGLLVGGEGDAKRETAKLWKCNECGGLFKTMGGLHIHVTRKHRRKATTQRRHRSVKGRWRIQWVSVPIKDHCIAALCAAPGFELGTTASMGGHALSAKSVGGQFFVSMAEDECSAKSAGAATFVSMGDNALTARSAGAAAYVSMGDNALCAKSAGVAPFVSMGDNAFTAKSVGAAPFVSMGDDALSAKSAGAALIVSMGDDALTARSAGAAAYVSMGEYGITAKSAGAAPFVSIGEYALSAKSVGAAAYVSMGENALSAKSVGAAPSVSMGGYALGAKSAGSERSQLPVASPCREERSEARSLCDTKLAANDSGTTFINLPVWLML
uniref:C2H2-type domain-containing protein n=1 Tax=Chromera velia CCMP2878 TaxID=1169474 RepID=A0A0G4I5K0_9ALVE|eukprot:Cvel_1838.t1-p1 / transcript=Cvel_1838.t1 / gene=Cvel_1838 / organism=Chromera_velia_CCMP2878 / gene_product=Zinc finger protein 420, putative / transcript_product=Zinc finger protein 420, putative / location=Cvel_scaffold68:2044-4173(+) / protein_length=500 / sequence_SO=supercontig / SO=protein_coding / is_pseudo=false